MTISLGLVKALVEAALDLLFQGEARNSGQNITEYYSYGARVCNPLLLPPSMANLTHFQIVYKSSAIKIYV